MSSTVFNLRELVATSFEDVHISRETLKNSDTPFIRRTFVRTVFAAVEASSYLLKQHCLKKQNRDFFSDTEIVLLREESYSLNSRSEPSIRQQFLPTADSLRFSMMMFIKTLKNYDKQDLIERGWTDFKTSLSIRNKIVHPKNMVDFVISDEDILLVEKAYVWVISNVFYLLIYKIEELELDIEQYKEKMKELGLISILEDGPDYI